MTTTELIAHLTAQFAQLRIAAAALVAAGEQDMAAKVNKKMYLLNKRIEQLKD